MADLYVTPHTAAGQTIETPKSAVAWAAILAGTAVAIAISLVLLMLGSGLGFASMTPFTRSSVSAAGAGALAIVWVVIVQWLSAASGGYITGRLRTRWVGTHTHEVFFRDTAHGFVTWAVATAIVAMVVASAATSLLASGIHGAASAATQGAAIVAQEGGAAPYEVDALFRGGSVAPATESRGEASRILVNGLSVGEVPAADRTYLAKLVAERAGISLAEAQRRVDDTIARVQAEAEKARKAAAMTSLINALAMMIGAFVACAGAALGGRERDRHP